MTLPQTDAQRLADAQAALHSLKLGRLSVEVEVDGRKVRYSRTDVDTLQGYVRDLTDRLAGRCSRHGGIGFIL